MVEMTTSGSGEGSVWVTGRGYSTRDGSSIEEEIKGTFPVFIRSKALLRLTFSL